MFDRLFRYPAIVRRHHDGPLAAERGAYLASLAAQGSAPGTLLKCARYCLAIAHVLQAMPHDQSFTKADIDVLAGVWAAGRVKDHHAAAPRWPHQHFRAIATDFLKSLGRWTPLPVASCPYERQVDDFVTAERQDRLRSASTCRNRRWQIERFLSYLVQRNCELAAVTPDHLDAYFQHAAQRWSRVSLRSAALSLRSWFHHCEGKGWVRQGLAAAILVPRVYRDESIPIGPTWEDVARLITDADGETRLQRRNAAMLRLLAIYGLRSGEIRRLQLQDIDWATHRIVISRSKSAHRDVFPLEPSVEHAIRRYVRDARPQSDHSTLFLTVRAPFRPLSAGALYHLVQSRTPATDRPRKGRGPHGLRHACARHLIDAGLSFKEVGDHLGHRSPDSTRIYAKVNLAALRLVALEDLGGLL
ncbi:MAG: tyrosine-type recombinase/integrase [Stellaceae bacterium]